jgi:hypothetical protein
MKTEEEIIVETVKFYLEDLSRRAEDEIAGTCRYQTYDNKNCAVGRCMIKPIPPELVKTNTPVGFIYDLDSLLLPEYRGHSTKFWRFLQKIHDYQYYWIRDQEGVHSHNSPKEELTIKLRDHYPEALDILQKEGIL